MKFAKVSSNGDSFLQAKAFDINITVILMPRQYVTIRYAYTKYDA